jgi:hypothetical protein
MLPIGGSSRWVGNISDESLSAGRAEVDEIARQFEYAHAAFQPLFNMFGPFVSSSYTAGFRRALERATPSLKCVNLEAVVPSAGIDSLQLEIPRFEPRDAAAWAAMTPIARAAEHIALGTLLQPYDAPAFAPDIGEEDLLCASVIDFDPALPMTSL